MAKQKNVDWGTYFRYDESSFTCLKWVNPFREGVGGKPVKRINNGDAGSITSRGQLVVYLEQWPYPAKDVIWELHYGKIPEGGEVWYKDSDIRNIKIDNLYIQQDIVKSHKYDKFLGDYLEYDPSSPSCLRWKARWKRGSTISPGDVAGSLDTADGYWKVHGLNGNFKGHKIVWAIMNNYPNQKGLHIDHLNGIRSDNRIENLRLIEPEFNARNQGIQKNSKTGVNGVIFSIVKTKCGNFTERFVACAAFNGKKKTKAFSPFVHGYEGAFQKACYWRERMIEEFNEQGAGYTERHGT